MDKNRRVLVIDDQESIHADFRKILGSKVAGGAAPGSARSAFFGEEEAATDDGAGFELTSALQGDEGVRLIGEACQAGESFAMAFVDVRMPPGPDGIQTIKGLWEQDPDLQVVICTAFSDYSFEEIIDELGATDRMLILKKPFDPVEVRQLAASLTEKRFLIRQMRAQIEELADAHEQVRSASRAKSEFLANMSHEIRTPMNSILGYVDLLCDPETAAEERQKYGQTIRTSSEHLLTILNDILDISRIEASRLVVNATDFSPFDLVRDVASMTIAEASKKDLELTVEAPLPIPEAIESDLVRVRQILLNLVNNAIKFTDRGKVRIVLRLDDLDAAEHRFLCFDVIDTGVGIRADKLDGIFEAFSQADSSSTRRYGGTGLGLTISKRLALLLGGDIEVESRPGQGSRFTLRLYAGELHKAALRKFTAAECADFERESLISHKDEALEGRILLVEDVALNRRLMTAMLNRTDVEIGEAEHGREGVEKALAAARDGNPFDLIVMDMQMPVMDGYEAVRELRRSGYKGPILALTAHAMSGDRDKCLAAGCDEYATKPVERKALIRLCRQLIEQGRAAA